MSDDADFEVKPIVDHVTRGLAALTGRFRDDDGAKAFIRPLLEEVQRIEDLAYGVLNMLNVDVAQGYWLDRFGRIVQQPRLGFDNTTYRKLILARGIANRSQGHIDDIIAIIGVITEPSSIEWIQKGRVSVFQYHVSSPLSQALRDALIDIVDAIAPAGSKIRLYECRTNQNVGFDKAPGAIGFDRGYWSTLLVRST